MNIRKTLSAGILALAAVSSGAYAAAQKEALSPVWQRIDPAWDKVSQKIVAFAGEDKQKLLANLAYAAVAGDLCEGLTLDAKAFQAEFDNNFGDAAYKAKSAADLAQYSGKVSMYFGVYVGMLTAVGMQERDDFCGAAKDMLAKGEGRYWTAAPASPVK